jgi:hypothetical protein
MVECFAELFANWEASVLLKGFFSFHYLKPAIFYSLLFVDCLLLKHVVPLTSRRVRVVVLLAEVPVFATTSNSGPDCAFFVQLGQLWYSRHSSFVWIQLSDLKYAVTDNCYFGLSCLFLNFGILRWWCVCLSCIWSWWSVSINAIGWLTCKWALMGGCLRSDTLWGLHQWAFRRK